MSARPASWWHALADGQVQCDLCPRDCALRDGQRGVCFVRQAVDGGLVQTAWGRSSGFCVDPIEKKPLHHFLPGSRVLSFGTAGCNLTCAFCQNWDISRARQMDTLAANATPEAIAAEAVRLNCASVAFTYNDPVVFAEYAMAAADACHTVGIQTVAVTAGYIHAAPRAALFAKMDAVNVDLKAFSDSFYQRFCGGQLQPVLDTLLHLVREAGVWTEITTLLIPGHNDSDAELSAMCRWIAANLGVDVPLHFSAFHPDYKLMQVPATPLATLRRARALAQQAGLRHVYLGNVRDPVSAATSCPGCGRVVIGRDGYAITRYALTSAGECEACKMPISGRFGPFSESFGNRRIASALGRDV